MGPNFRAPDSRVPRHPAPGTQGFTLIELLVSLALLAVTATLLLAALTTGRGVERRASAAAVAGESIAAAHNLLRDRIETMVPETFLLGVVPTVDMRGEATLISFTAAPTASARPAPPRRYTLLLTRAGELSLFSVDALSTRVNQRARDLAGWDRSVLIGNVAGLDIAYFGVGPPDRQRRWRNFWQDRPALPELIRIRVEFAPGDPRVWPDLIARPAATVNALCVVEPVTGRCAFGPQ